jgi:antitoxin HicB
MTKKKRHPRLGSSVDDLLEEEGVLDQFQAVAVKEVIACQIQQAMKKRGCRRTRWPA